MEDGTSFTPRSTKKEHERKKETHGRICPDFHFVGEEEKKKNGDVICTLRNLSFFEHLFFLPVAHGHGENGNTPSAI